jgi:uncharacterized MAPEG superfamily protein
VLFVAAALMAYVTQVSSPLAAKAAIAYVIARFLYSLFYIFKCANWTIANVYGWLNQHCNANDFEPVSS